MSHPDQDDLVKCPGERSPISYAVCKGRQRRHFPFCGKCPVPLRQQGEGGKVGGSRLEVFRESDILGLYPDQIDEQMARKIGAGLSQFLQGKQLAVGYDMRTSSEPLAKAARAGINSTGVTALDIGQVSTEVFYFAIGHYKCDGGLMVTGCQHPLPYNGFKACREGARLLTAGTGIGNIQAIVERGLAATASVAGRVEKRDPFPDYRNHILNLRPAIRKTRLVLDAGNGMAAGLLPPILAETECEIIPLNFQADGSFSNHDPNPLQPDCLQTLRKQVIECGADLGVAFDGDADCAVFVDEHGEAIHPDLVTALIAREALRQESHATIVYDLRSSRVVPEEIRRAGGTPCQVPAGHAEVKAALRKRQGVFGGGPQAQYCYRDHFYADSAALTLLKVLGALTSERKTTSQLFMPLRRYYRTGEVEIKVADRDEAIRALAKRFTNGKINYLDGITVEFENWWFNARKTETGSYLRLNLEATTPEIMEKAKQTVLDVIAG